MTMHTYKGQGVLQLNDGREVQPNETVSISKELAGNDRVAWLIDQGFLVPEAVKASGKSGDAA